MTDLLNPVKHLRRLVLMAVLLMACASTSLGWRAWQPRYAAERLEVDHLLGAEAYKSHEGMLTRLDFLQDSMQLKSGTELWNKLQWFHANANFLGGDGSESRAIVNDMLTALSDQKDTYLYRLFLLTDAFSSPIEGDEGNEQMTKVLELMDYCYKANDRQFEFDLCIHLSETYIDVHRRDLAWQWLGRADSALVHVNDPVNCSVYYTSAADASNPRRYDANGKLVFETLADEHFSDSLLAKAIECGREAEAQGQTDMINMAWTYHIRADFWKSPKDHIKWFKQSVGESYKKDDLWGIFWGQLRLVGAYISDDDFPHAKHHLDSCALIVKSFGLKGAEKALYSQAISYYENLGTAPDSTIKYLKLMHTTQMELTENETLIKLEENKAKFQDAQQKVTILEQQAEISESNRKTKNLYIIIGLTVLIVLVILIIYLRARNANRVIRSMVKKLQDAVIEREVLIQEVNHRVKNNLQMITTFVDIQARGIKSVETTNFGESIRKRIRAVSLVHELMLEEERLAKIQFQAYAKELVNELETLHYKGESFSFDIEAIDIEFGLSTTMYLGILLNELVSNSIKHASQPEESLSIWVTLTKPNEKYLLTYRDSGPGIPEKADENNSKSIGLYLMRSMARQLDGELVYDRENDGMFKLEFMPQKD